MPRATAGLRLWALLVASLAILLALGLALYAGLEQWLSAAVRVEADAIRLARLAASGHQRLLEGVRPLLVALAASPEVRRGDAAACSALLADLLARTPHYVNLGVALPDGTLLCSALPIRSGTSVDPRLVRKAFESADVTAGDYETDPVSGQPAVGFAYAVREADHRVQAVVFAALDLAWLARVAAETRLPEGATLTVVDQRGTIVARHPEPRLWVGKALRSAGAVRAILTQAEGTTEVVDLDGVRRVYAVSRLGDLPESGLLIGVGISRERALVEANRRLLGYLGLGLLAVVMLGAGWAASRWRSGRGSQPSVGAPVDDTSGRVSDLVAQRAREVAFQSQLSGLLQVCLTVEEAAAVVGRLFGQFLPGEAGALFVAEASRDEVERVAVWGRLAADGRPIFQVGQCWALRRGQAHVVEDTSSGLGCPHLQGALPSAYLCVPLRAQGETLGLLHLSAGTAAGAGAGRRFMTDSRQRLMATIPEQLGLALANLKLREKLRIESIRDPLTGLFNRRYMEESLGIELLRAQRDAHPVGLLLIDVDHFRRFNEAFGHDGGDAVLAALGELLRGKVRGGDIACRHGGEEFVILLPGATLVEVRRRADELREAARGLEVAHRGQLVTPVTVSIGVATYPQHGATREALLRAADAALYRAKQKGRDQVAVAD